MKSSVSDYVEHISLSGITFSYRQQQSI